MSRVTGVRLLLTLAALACVGSSTLVAFGSPPGAHFPMRLLRLPNGLYRIEPLPHSSLPAGLRAGDLIPIRRLEPVGRAAVFAQHDVASGSVLTLPIIRAGRQRVVAARAMVDKSTALETVEFLGFQTVMFAIAMLTLWRGRDWAAWGLSAVTVVQISGRDAEPSRVSWSDYEVVSAHNGEAQREPILQPVQSDSQVYSADGL